jgi:tetratricopeptide (TPR) repeat protein
VESDPEIQKALESVVLVKFDAEKGEGLELAKKFEVHGYPTFVVANQEAVTMDTWAGYGKEGFIADLGAAVADPTTISEKQARFAKSPTAADAAKLARYHDTRSEHKPAVDLYRKAGALDPSNDYAFEILETQTSGFRSGAFTKDEVRMAADAMFASEGQEPIRYIWAVSMLRGVARQAEDPAFTVPYIEPALARTADVADPAFQQQRVSLEVDRALFIEKDKGKAYTLKLASMPEGWKEEPARLNGFAWWCFENDVKLSDAEAFARRGVELSSAGPDRAQILDTVAEICNARGNCDDAVELIRQAMAEAPDSDYYPKQLERFQQIRAEKAN